MRLFLCGDVMIGRGIDQILPSPGDPVLYEGYMDSAVGYVRLAERQSGPIPRGASFDYVWGDALAALEARTPDVRVINLETSITRDGIPEAKGINYRMHPGNVGCLTAARVDCCVLANNHVADWGIEGLVDTLDALAQAGIATVGAGRDANEAEAPAIIATPDGARLVTFAFGSLSSGVPESWQAGPDRPGVSLLGDLDSGSVARVAALVAAWARPGDVVMVSIHWGPNWGYDVPDVQRRFAHALIEAAGVHAVYGHSSHHPKAIEVHAGRPILYGCGDLINDYEGIEGQDAFRPDLVLGYVLDLDAAQGLRSLELLPFRLHRFRLCHASGEARAWLEARLDRECRRFGHRILPTPDGTMSLAW